MSTSSNCIAVIAPGLMLRAEEIEAVRAAGVPMFAIANVAIDYTPDAVGMYASDGQWWDHYLPQLEDFQGRKFTQEAVSAGRYSMMGLEWVEWLHEYDGVPPSGKTTGCSSGEHALYVVADVYRPLTILLLGYEYGAAGTGHYFGAHPTQVASASHWPTMINSMNKTAARLGTLGVRVINCTPVTALECFHKATLEEGLELAKSGSLKTRRTGKEAK
jgi:hypothetical protein